LHQLNKAFAPAKHLKKEDNSMAKVEETLTMKVIEFNRDDKRIIVSHLRYLDDIRREAEGEVRQEKEKEQKEVRKSITKAKSKVEMTTLGELEAFSQLKAQLSGEEPAAAAPAKEEKPAEAAVPEALAEEAKPAEAAAPAEAATPAEAAAPAAEEAAPVVEAAEEAAPAAPAATEAPAADAGADDLKKIEGVGPKIAEILAAGGLETFAKVAAADVDSIKAILEEAGPRYKMHDPTTWPKQAGLAAEGKWDELQKWQDELDGGK